MVEVRGLREWLTASFRITPDKARRGLSRAAHPEGVSIELEGLQLRLALEAAGGAGRLMPDVATATYEFDRTIELGAFLTDWLAPLQHFLVLATREQSLLQSLTIERYDERRWARVAPLVRHATSPDALNRWMVQAVRTPNVPLAVENPQTFTKILLPAAAIADELDCVLRRWYKLDARLREAGVSFFTRLNQHGHSLNDDLLGYVSFAETYHRLNSANFPCVRPLPPDDHERLRDIMLAALDNASPSVDEREVYKQALGNANQLKNARRIAEVFARACTVGIEIDLESESLPGALVATRNYLAHWSARKVLEGAARAQALRKLTVALQVNLLLDLELSPDLVRRCVSESYMHAVW